MLHLNAEGRTMRDGVRPDTGMTWNEKRDHYGDLLLKRYYDPDLYRDERPPPELQVALEEIFGEAAVSGKVKLRLHPWFRRWSLWERMSTSHGENVWNCFWICHEKSRPDYLPPDLNEQRFENLRGDMGDFKVPTRTDLQLVRELADTQYNPLVKRVKLATKWRDDVKKESDRVFEAFHHDMLHYMFRMAYRDANDGQKGIVHLTDMATCKEAAACMGRGLTYKNANGIPIKLRGSRSRFEIERDRKQQTSMQKLFDELVADAKKKPSTIEPEKPKELVLVRR